jgi:hypothetical protein
MQSVVIPVNRTIQRKAIVFSSSYLAKDSNFEIDGSVSLKTTELPFVLFHDWRLVISAHSSIYHHPGMHHPTALLLDNNLTLHAPVAETASVTTLERISARGLCEEFDRGRLSLFELPTLLRRWKDQTGLAVRFGTIRNIGDFETMVVVRCRDFELNFGSGLDMKRRGQVLVLLCRQLNNPNLLVLG